MTLYIYPLIRSIFFIKFIRAPLRHSTWNPGKRYCVRMNLYDQLEFELTLNNVILIDMTLNIGNIWFLMLFNFL